MKNNLARFALISSGINRQHLQILLMIIALAMLILGAGAPTDGGGIIH